MRGWWRSSCLFLIMICVEFMDGRCQSASSEGISTLEPSYRLQGALWNSPSDKGWTREALLEIMDSGPGSKPPRCDKKCGKCTPCTPIRVPVQPGPHKIMEYYPEAWRCKCKGKLYMP